MAREGIVGSALLGRTGAGNRAGAGIGRGLRRAAGDVGSGNVPRSVDDAAKWLKPHLHDHPLLGEVKERAAVRKSLDQWLDTVAESVAHGGPSTTAALRAIDSTLNGKNPIWAAIKGLVSGLSRTVKVALVLLILLGLVLGPILLVLALLALLVAGLAIAVRAATR
ncbi:hypothetical protein ACFTZB_41015 [Rhodococcus sp. NPDC057014]|uniref:hypothetical protein n=1 Tax=Rhodococcus sp. NPDC057014 TaxID=3346000 RepID=UPI003630F8BD